MATEISSIEAIPTLQNINGISIQEIERRARPLKRSENNEIIYDKVTY
jgi:hypothetical protein